MSTTGDLAITVRRATASDAAALATLVNRAYAIEAFFVEGDRTNPQQIAEMMQTGTFVVLEHEAGLAAAVYIETRGYFGMLAVLPELQGLGLGKRLVRIAEAICEASGATVMSMKIIDLRKELYWWYRSLGYREVGTAPYTHRTVKQPCHFIEMQRSLVASRAAA